MLTRSLLLSALVVFVGGQAVQAQEKSVVDFGVLEATDAKTAQAEAAKWIKSTGKPVNAEKLTEIWSRENRTVLDRISDTLALGSVDAEKLLKDAANPLVPAPTTIPAILANKKAKPFFRHNLALAYARHLSHRRVFEQALDALETTKAEDVADPGSYLFYRAVCEHGLQQKNEANTSINRLIDEVLDTPERYRTVSILMLLDMQAWQTQDLQAVGRLMKNSERRLRLARANGNTPRIQKKIIRRLDEMIKKLENQANQQKKGGGGGGGGGGIPNAGSCPDGSGSGGSGGGEGGSPMQDSNVGGGSGPGNVDEKKIKKLTEKWGSLPEREREQILNDLTQGLSQAHREAIENYFRNLARRSARRY
ncbi:MAG: hypothetical protein ACFCD0_17605 [Gemmataceae bacterium]